jgi:hypothetical protein
MKNRFSLIGFIPLLVITAYCVFGDVSARANLFAMLSMTWLGAWELAMLLRCLMNGPRTRRTLLRHGLVGMGGLMTGYAVLQDMQTLPFAVGCLSFSMGLLIEPQSAPRSD